MLGPQIQPHVSATADPRLIAANTIIHYSAVELEQAIMREIDENPALEMTERLTCPLCARSISGSKCVSCSPGVPDERISSDSGVTSLEDELDPFWSVAAPLTLPECLLDQLRLILNEGEQEIALHVVGNLDEHGYLNSSSAELAQVLQVEESRVQYIVDELQELDPPGIGAHTVQECLLLQVRRLVDQGVTIPSATEAIISDHLEALGRHHFESIRHALLIDREEVEEAFLFIRNNLHPYPAHHYYAQSSDSQTASLNVGPSVLIHRTATEPHDYEVEVVESQRFLIRVNPLYWQLHHQSQQVISPAEREHVAHFLERARLFISALQRRHSLLQRLVTCLVAFQRDFLDNGSSGLRPLSQTSVAKELAVHPSTVSRATAGKFAQLPSRNLLPLRRFFVAGTQAQEFVYHMIQQETTPLSDERLAARLREEHGIVVSRQMIANYRAELHIPAARQRALVQSSKRRVV